MAIALTTQPTNNGYYTGYLPVNFVATETTNNPAYLTFELKTSSGATIPNIPKYKAPNINNEYFFDASNYLKSIFNTRTLQGLLDTNNVAELTDIYGKFEVVVSDTINALSPLTSNEFYAFAFLDNRMYTNSQTANYPIGFKGLLYGSDVTLATPNYFARKLISGVDIVSLFVTKTSLVIDTYLIDEPNNSSTIFETGLLDLTTYANKLVSVPLNQTFVISEFVKSGGGTLSAYTSFRIRESGTPTNNCMYYHVNKFCNINWFAYVNRYGCKEQIGFQSYLNEKASTKSDEFMSGKFDYLSVFGDFNTSAETYKINQEFSQEVDVRGQYFSIAHKEEIRDFINSQWHLFDNNGKACFVNLFDGAYTLVDGGRGIKFNFKYKNSQKPLSFI